MGSINIRKGGATRVGYTAQPKAGEDSMFNPDHKTMQGQPMAKTKRKLPVASAKPMKYSKTSGKQPC